MVHGLDCYSMVSWDRYPDAEPEQAILAQLVEQLLRKHQVIRSSRIDGTSNREVNQIGD